MWGIAAIVAFGFSLLLWVAQPWVHAGHVFTWQTFTIAGLALLAVHEVRTHPRVA